jgi:hypothetical protein
MIDILNPFHNPEFHKIDNTEIEIMFSEYYSKVKVNTNKLLSEIYSSEMFGKDTEHLYNILNDFNYLLGLMIIIKLERENDSRLSVLNGGCGNDLGNAYYADKYDIDCIQKHFSCIGTGYDIQPILDMFSVNPDVEEKTGISYMSIDYNDSNCLTSNNVFIIR